MMNERTLYPADITYNLSLGFRFLAQHARCVDMCAIDAVHPNGAKVITYPVMTSINSAT